MNKDTLTTKERQTKITIILGHILEHLFSKNQ